MLTRSAVEDFLYAEAALLDEWRLEEWLALWTEDASYFVPATDHVANPDRALALIADDHAGLTSRVHQLVTGTAWTEVPRSRTCHMVSNVRVVDATEHAVIARSAFAVHRSRGERRDLFTGHYEHELVVGPSIRIRRKHIFLAHDSLLAQAKISILL